MNKRSETHLYANSSDSPPSSPGSSGSSISEETLGGTKKIKLSNDVVVDMKQFASAPIGRPTAAGVAFTNTYASEVNLHDANLSVDTLHSSGDNCEGGEEEEKEKEEDKKLSAKATNATLIPDAPECGCNCCQTVVKPTMELLRSITRKLGDAERNQEMMKIKAGVRSYTCPCCKTSVDYDPYGPSFNPSYDWKVKNALGLEMDTKAPNVETLMSFFASADVQGPTKYRCFYCGSVQYDCHLHLHHLMSCSTKSFTGDISGVDGLINIIREQSRSEDGTDGEGIGFFWAGPHLQGELTLDVDRRVMNWVAQGPGGHFEFTEKFLLYMALRNFIVPSKHKKDHWVFNYDVEAMNIDAKNVFIAAGGRVSDEEEEESEYEEIAEI